MKMIRIIRTMTLMYRIATLNLIIVSLLLHCCGSESIVITATPPTAGGISQFLADPAVEARYRKVFRDAIGAQGNFVRDSSYDLAARWIIFDDPMQLGIDDPNLIRRYIMALFYLQTSNNGNTPWKACNPPDASLEEDYNCVFAYGERLDDNSIGFTNIDAIRWMSEKSECEWVGVWCENNILIGIELQFNGLNGALPVEIAYLEYFAFIILSFNDFIGTVPVEWATEIEYLFMVELMNNLITGTIPIEFFEVDKRNLWELNFSQNLVTGTIPTEIGQVTELQNLYLFESEMTGTIPTEIGNISDLHVLRIHNNNFYGTIPTEIGHNTKLTELLLDSSEYTGSIPTEIGNLIQLDHLFLHKNQISGTIPTQIGNLINLERLFLYQNSISGTIPSEVGNLQKLEYLAIDDNTYITGTIPEELYNMVKLTRLDIFNIPNLTGTISTKIGELIHLKGYRVKQTSLYGTIPTEIGQLSELISVWIHQTKLSGDVPFELCFVTGLYKQRGGNLNADCLPEDNAPNPCLCCSGCCNRETGQCKRMPYAY